VIFKLRALRPDDFETLYEIDQACYEPAIAYSRRELRNFLRFPGADCVVAEANGEIAGFIVTARGKERGYIVTIDVLEAYRQQGVGSKLLAEAEQRLAAGGVRMVTLETATDNTSGIAFWKKHGYRKRGVAKEYYPDGRDAYSMAKSITAKS
jgi:ribosomal protein S18 acetylase RimI-like enzyme